MDPQWLDWAKRLQAIAQNGIAYNDNPYDIERYEAVRRIAAEIMAGAATERVGDLVRLFERQDGYATPKVDVRAIVFRQGKLLMVREVLDGGWTPPGGWADVCESPSQSVVREVLEESGFEVRAVKLLAAYDRSLHPHEPHFPFHVLKLFFLCELLGGAPRESNETSAVGFFGPDELPELSITRITEDELRRMFQHHADPGLASDFD